MIRIPVSIVPSPLCRRYPMTDYSVIFNGDPAWDYGVPYRHPRFAIPILPQVESLQDLNVRLLCMLRDWPSELRIRVISGTIVAVARHDYSRRIDSIPSYRVSGIPWGFTPRPRRMSKFNPFLFEGE